MWQRLLENRTAWTVLTISVMVLGGIWAWRSRVLNAQGLTMTGPVPQVGFAAPGFTLETLDGKESTLAELYPQ